MPKSNYSRKSARIFPASDLSDKCLKRRLERLRRKHHGACARLASQSQAFATDDPRQDRFFCSALLESLANHLLYNKSLYADAARLMPVLPNPHAQWDKLEEQLVRWQDLTFSPSALSTPSTTKLWPLTHSKVEAAQASPNAKLAGADRCFSTRRPSWDFAVMRRSTTLYVSILPLTIIKITGPRKWLRLPAF